MRVSVSCECLFCVSWCEGSTSSTPCPLSAEASCRLGSMQYRDERKIGEASKYTLLFHTPMIIKRLGMVGLSLLALMFQQKMRNR